MRRMKKPIVVACISLFMIIVLSIMFIFVFVLKKPTSIADVSKTKLHKWNKIALSGQTISSDGSDYYMFTKRGESNHWMIYFSGGGANWDAHTASMPIGLKNFASSGELGFYFANIPFYKLNLLGGILDDNPDNPFKDWNIVYIPYSTGDFHIGDQTVKYTDKKGKEFTVHYNGKKNVHAALDWVYKHSKQPDKLLIAGESAGGFGSAFWASEIASHYPSSEIYQYSDSSYLNTTKWPYIVDKVWNADFERSFGYKPDKDLISSAFISNGSKMSKDVVLLQSSTIYDEMSIFFQSTLNEVSPDDEKIKGWSEQLRKSTKKLSSSLPNYYYYLTDYGYKEKSHTTPHTLSPLKSFYEADEDGVKLYNWLDDVINHDKRYSVGQNFIEKEEGSR